MSKLKFTNAESLRFSANKITPYLKNFSNIGVDFNILTKKYSRTNVEDTVGDVYSVFFQEDERLTQEYTPYFDRMYERKVEYLYQVAANTEIETILTTIADSSVIFDNNNYFCYLNIQDLNLTKDVKTRMNINFKKIYNLLGFSDGKTAWSTFYRWMIEGFVTFEIVYRYKKKSEIDREIAEDEERVRQLIMKSQRPSSPVSSDESLVWVNEAKEIKAKVEARKAKLMTLCEAVEISSSTRQGIIGRSSQLGINVNKEDDIIEWDKEDLVPIEIVGFKPIANNSIVPIIYEDPIDGKKMYLWKYMLDGNKYRILHDFQIVRSSWSQVGASFGKISYVERLVRNFNLTRKMEESRVAWNIMNSQFRLKMIIPLSGKLSKQVEQSLRQLVNKNKEELTIQESGEVFVNGNPHVAYGKTISLPKRANETPDISGISYGGPDLSNMDAPKHFRDNLWRDSFVPFSRFDRSGTMGSLSLFKADGIPYDEIAYHNFKNRVMREFVSIIKKPLYNAILLEFPELKIDLDLKLKIGFSFNTDSYFEQAKTAEISEAQVRTIKSMMEMVDDDGKPIWSAKYLWTKKFKFITEDEWNEKDRMLKAESDKAEMETGTDDTSFDDTPIESEPAEEVTDTEPAEQEESGEADEIQL